MFLYFQHNDTDFNAANLIRSDDGRPLRRDSPRGHSPICHPAQPSQGNQVAIDPWPDLDNKSAPHMRAIVSSSVVCRGRASTKTIGSLHEPSWDRCARTIIASSGNTRLLLVVRYRSSNISCFRLPSLCVRPNSCLIVARILALPLISDWESWICCRVHSRSSG